jgi:hypothetical protein
MIRWKVFSNPYVKWVDNVLAVGWCTGIAILLVSLALAFSEPKPVPATPYQAVPTVTIAPPKSRCVTKNEAAQYYDVHQAANLCVIK